MTPLRQTAHYQELALKSVREIFPNADTSCFSGRYEIAEVDGVNCLVDNEAEWAYPGRWYPHTLHIMENAIVDLLARDGLKTLMNCVFYNGLWCYSLPQQTPDVHGRRIFSRMVKRNMGEFYEWGVDEEGFPYERHEKTGETRITGKNYLKRIPLRDFIQQLNMLRKRFRGSEFSQELKKGREDFISIAEEAFAREQSQMASSSPYSAEPIAAEKAPSANSGCDAGKNFPTSDSCSGSEMQSHAAAGKPASTASKAWYCTECGSKHARGKYCTNCGAKRYGLR